MVPWPASMVPPAEMVQRYPVIPFAVEYKNPEKPGQTTLGPVTTGTGNGFTVIVTVFVDRVPQPLEEVWFIR